MTKNNDYTFDIHLNASIIESKIQEACSALSKKRCVQFFKNTGIENARTLADLNEAKQRCGNIKYMSKQLQDSATANHISMINLLVPLIIEKAHGYEKPIACVLAPLFNKKNRADGYIRRIENIDSLIPREAFRFYLYSNECAMWPTIEITSDNCVFITYNDSDDIREAFNLIIENSKIVYCHSVYRFDTALLGENVADKLYLDFHGAVPEEILCLTGDEEKSRAFNRIERQAVKAATTIIAVTNNMVAHIKAKYPEESSATTFLVMPILDTDLHVSSLREVRVNDAIRIVYAGGMQKWQLFDEMMDAIRKQPNLAEYRLFVPDIEAFSCAYGSDERLAQIQVQTVSPEQLRLEYQTCDFGFILRDDSTVNKVACPTKLIEYLANGVVPIVKNPAIGDFLDDGYTYIELDDFLEGNIPDSRTCRNMMEKNFRTLKLQASRYIEGKTQLQKTLTNALECERKQS